MALNIEGASIGYDANNVQQALTNLNIQCIERTITTMNSEMVKLRDVVDSAWVGASAEQFKKNMQSNVEYIENQIEAAKTQLEDEFHNIINKMQDMDDNLVGKWGEK